ncbi:MAG: hypothetical protein ACO3OX_07865 [Burkholderiaceae bacterium]
MRNHNNPGLIMMGAFAMGMAALIIVAWAEDAQREMQFPKPVLAITSVTV